MVVADLNRPDTLQPAFTGAHGIFLVTNFWEQGTDEFAQGTAAVRAAKAAGVKHFVWSTLPNVEAISGGRFHVPHFTGKAKVDRVVTEAGFANHTFVIAPFFYQNLTDALAPQQQLDGSMGWALPLDPRVRCIHMGDIRELGDIVAGAFALPDQAGHRGTSSPSIRSRKTVFLAKWPTHSLTSKRTRIWARIRRIELRSQTESPADNRPRLRRGRD